MAPCVSPPHKRRKLSHRVLRPFAANAQVVAQNKVGNSGFKAASKKEAAAERMGGCHSGKDDDDPYPRQDVNNKHRAVENRAPQQELLRDAAKGIKKTSGGNARASKRQAAAPAYECYDSNKLVTFTKKPNGLLESFHDRRFVLKRKLGKGSFGVVYLGMDNETKSQVAIKIERHRGRRTMTKEIRILQGLNAVCDGAPTIIWSGDVGSRQIMVMQCLGRDLAGLFESCKRKFSLQTVLLLTEQMIDRIEEVHQAGYVHRDIKPHNFMTSKVPWDPDLSRDPEFMHRYIKIYVIDFGLSADYLDSKGQHVGLLKGLQPVGTARYSSINNHRGLRQSRRDDLESIAHLFVYFLRGDLPWQSIKENDRVRKWRKIMWKKEDTTVEELCVGLPIEFEMFLRTVRQMRYEKKPDYDWARKLFRRCYVDHGFNKLPAIYDWDNHRKE